MELKIQTAIGEMTGVFESHPINSYQDYYVAWFKEKPSIIVQADSINEGIDELMISLKVMLDFEISENN
jgi:hypothetical protein